MLEKIEHIALAVEDLEAALAHYRDVWGIEAVHRDRVEDQGVEEVMLPIGDTFLQLLGATGPDTIVARFLKRRGEGLHHIAYEVDDLDGTLATLKERGVRLIDEAPRQGARDQLVAFVDPKSNHGLLVELIQRPAPTI
ncbi:MAG: methylmalonyl-CoA/ethylmalonyl-CoA epimerase [Actinomycetota bacterium]|jgi:methylmalonyl-CoA/ethylmalonyl-CoA epimerase|nr:methylmalonyl-CoA/ethylmalonyl-CoA epimerase [Actinomycetota bacterium]